MLSLSPETQAIILERADKTGRTADEIVRESLTRTGDLLPWRSSAAPPSDNLSREELIARMEHIALRSAGRLVVDPRSVNEIIGYDDFGLPR